MFTIDFELFEKKICSKFNYIWPSAKTTPPTEGNITATFIEILVNDYFCFAEVPILDGRRVDLVLIEKSLEEIVFLEFKSSKKTSCKELTHDIERLNSISVNDLIDCSIDPSQKTKVIFQWSENPDEIKKNF